MPRGDRTGPWGEGPMTGRAAGYCAGFDVPGYANPGPAYGRGLGAFRGGRAFGRGYGRGGYGRGWGYGAGPGWGGRRFARPYPWAEPVGYAPPPPAEEATALEREAEWLRQQLSDLDARISELKGTAGEKEKAQDE